MAREFRRIGVVGLGTMGAGIAEVLAKSGLDVVGVEVEPAALERGLGHLRHSTDRAVARGKLDAAGQAAILARIELTTDLARLSDADLVVEAIPERLDLKKDLFARLDRICRPDAILATNTSSLSVTEIAVATQRPDLVLGLHFFNPAPVMRLVEIIRTVVTDQDVVDDAEALVARLGKTDVTVGDRAGFIANALLFGYLNNAVRMLEARYATAEDVDTAMRLGCGHPMGPFALLDLIGLDSAYEILETMYRQTRDRLHAPAPLVKQLVTAGFLGRKTGRGFYVYDDVDSPVVVAGPPAAATRRVEPARTVRRIGIAGSGAVATGVAEVAARSGYDVVLRARTATGAVAARDAVGARLARAVERGTATEDERAAALDRIAPTADLDALADCDLVLEAIVEDLAAKRSLFAALDGALKPGAVVATATSSLPVIACAAATGRPEDVVGLHFFSPVPAVQLVEVVPTIRTSEDTVAVARQLCLELGKHPIVCADRAGFVVNALLFPYLNDAVRMVEERYASADDVDHAMKLGCGHPMGPFELLDVVGLDVALAIQRALYLEFREPGLAPAPLLEHLVTAGYLGRRTGRGFRDYAES